MEFSDARVNFLVENAYEATKGKLSRHRTGKHFSIEDRRQVSDTPLQPHLRDFINRARLYSVWWGLGGPRGRKSTGRPRLGKTRGFRS